MNPKEIERNSLLYWQDVEERRIKTIKDLELKEDWSLIFDPLKNTWMKTAPYITDTPIHKP